MKKVLLFSILIIAIIMCLVACNGQTDHTHNFGEWSVTKNPTCTEDGVKTRYCSCGEKQNDVIPAIGHSYIDNTCLNCGDVKSSPECRHENLDILSAKNSTCTEAGLTEGIVCLDCGELLIAQQVVPLNAHVEETIPAVAASCTNTGLTEGKKCTICGTTTISQQEIPLETHTYDDKYDESCNKCGYIRDAECKHGEVVTIKGYDATCTSVGLTDGEQCKKCGEMVTSQSVIGVKNHTEVVDNAVDPTCTSTGLTEGKHCSVCEMILIAQNVVSRIDHTYSSVVVTKPTLDSQGYTTYTCECGYSYVGAYVAKLIPSEGLEFTLNDDGKSYSLTGIGTCTDDDIIIPSKYEGLPVTSIGYSAIYGSYGQLSSVVIPDSVINIDNSAFNVYYIDNIYIGSGVENISGWAFENCYDIYSITVNENNPTYYSSGNCIIERATNALVVGSAESIIPENVTKICSGAFAFRYELDSIVIPASVIEIEDDAFCECIYLDSVTFAENSKLKTISGFNYCRSMSAIEIPANVTTIGEYAFYNCTSLSTIEIPANVTTIGTDTFSNCTSLSTIEIPANVTTIGYGAFQGCKSLETVIFEQSSCLTTIGVYAFKVCTSLSTIEIPANVTTISSYAFSSCTNLKRVTFEEDSNLESIGDEAFYNCKSLTSITIPNSVTNIGYSLFSSCDNLTYNTKNGLNYLGNINNPYLYLGSTTNQDITTANIDSNCKFIGDYALSGCGNLSNVIIPSSVISISNSAFGTSSVGGSLKNITVDPNNMHYKDIDGNLYSKDGTVLLKYAGGKTTTTFVIPEGVISVVDGAFYYSKNLTSVTISSSVTSIGKRAFSYSNIKNVIFAKNSQLKDLNWLVFQYCYYLESITFAECSQLTDIPLGIFWGCSRLTSIEIPTSVTYIGQESFVGCRTLVSIYFKGTIEQWNAIPKYSDWNEETGNYTI